MRERRYQRFLEAASHTKAYCRKRERSLWEMDP